MFQLAVSTAEIRHSGRYGLILIGLFISFVLAQDASAGDPFTDVNDVLWLVRGTAPAEAFNPIMNMPGVTRVTGSYSSVQAGRPTFPIFANLPIWEGPNKQQWQNAYGYAITGSSKETLNVTGRYNENSRGYLQIFYPRGSVLEGSQYTGDVFEPWRVRILKPEAKPFAISVAPMEVKVNGKWGYAYGTGDASILVPGGGHPAVSSTPFRRLANSTTPSFSGPALDTLRRIRPRGSTIVGALALPEGSEFAPGAGAGAWFAARYYTGMAWAKAGSVATKGGLMGVLIGSSAASVYSGAMMAAAYDRQPNYWLGKYRMAGDPLGNHLHSMSAVACHHRGQYDQFLPASFFCPDRTTKSELFTEEFLRKHNPGNAPCASCH